MYHTLWAREHGLAGCTHSLVFTARFTQCVGNKRAAAAAKWSHYGFTEKDDGGRGGEEVIYGVIKKEIGRVKKKVGRRGVTGLV